MERNKKIKIILVHGNGGGTANDCWFPKTKEFLEKKGFNVVAETFPDNLVAHESIWLPYLKNELKADENTIIIGHSSGAVAALRYAEKSKIYGSVLVGVNYTDLGDELEKESGYYNHPWDWESIKKNQNWILQFSSTDDPYIPVEEPRFIHEKINSEYYEFASRGHFMIPDFPELLQILEKKLSEYTN